MKDAGLAVRSVGKIVDIFAGRGITDFTRTTCNEEGIDVTLTKMQEDFEGLCFTNLVDFDMKYGHRNDIDGYAKALTYFDTKLPEHMAGLGDDDLLMITADHGCDPATASTDHSREYIPLVAYGPKVRGGINVGTRVGFADIGKTIAERFGLANDLAGTTIPELGR